MNTPLTVLIIAIIAVVLALALAWVPARMILFAVGKSVGDHVREFVRRSRERRDRPRGTPDRRKDWSSGNSDREEKLKIEN